MFISIYDENLDHLANVDNVTYELTQRVYDFDTFIAEGSYEEELKTAKVAVLKTAQGDYVYSCLVEHISIKDGIQTIKGLDFKSVFDIEVLIDYTQGDFNSRLDKIFEKAVGLVLQDLDGEIIKIPIDIDIATDSTDTSLVFGVDGFYKIINAYKYLQGYMKYYEYNISTRFDEQNGRIKMQLVKTGENIDINLADFRAKLQTDSDVVNKVVATIAYSPDVDEGEPIPPRPQMATVYYYRDKQNNIVQSDKYGNMQGRIYPVRCKIFEAEYLADAQFEAVYEIASARYVDNVLLDHNKIVDPIDLAALPLLAKINLYDKGKFYKTLPITEKITTLDSDGENTQIKLGFKKILLTEILKGG